jgi:hypothetical protein
MLYLLNNRDIFYKSVISTFRFNITWCCFMMVNIILHLIVPITWHSKSIPSKTILHFFCTNYSVPIIKGLLSIQTYDICIVHMYKTRAHLFPANYWNDLARWHISVHGASQMINNQLCFIRWVNMLCCEYIAHSHGLHV